MNAIVKTADNQLAMQNRDELIKVLESSLYPGASRGSIELVLGYCQAAGLDPLQKPVHIVPMWDSKQAKMRDVVMPGINLYRIQASRSGECAGVTEPEFGEDVTAEIGGQKITYPKWCKVTVKRLMPNGMIVDFTAKELWIENYSAKGGKDKSVAPNSMWTKRPYGQLAKCAEAQAFRKAFPELASAYTADEMEGKEIHVNDVTPARDEPKVIQNYPSAEFEKNLEKWLKAIDEGKKTADDIIAMVESKGKLTDEQKGKIRRDKKEQVKVEGFDLPDIDAPVTIDQSTGEIVK